ncbi:GGDEF domain-containing protein [Ochrobactrum haematophilum]|uniref:diguanylate cyclase n=1 Tax=Brucella haematophila TaxID=419474 RepID=A0ABX1DQF0_9HYPH|nr:GGDEF domain-containing protein [Brucella haematophila]
MDEQRHAGLFIGTACYWDNNIPADVLRSGEAALAECRVSRLSNGSSEPPLTDSLWHIDYRINDENSRRRAVAVLDIDWFKSINDTYGHFAGDLVLQTLAQRLKSVLEADDFIARTGGEEFVIIFGEKSSLDAELAAEHIRNAVAESRFAIENASISVTVSIGLVTRNAPTKFDDVMIRADKALYTAKNNGRNRTEIVAMGNAERVI